MKSNVDVEKTESIRSDQIDSASAVNDGAIPCETVCSGARHRDSSAGMCRDDFDCDFNCDCVGSSKVLNVHAIVRKIITVFKDKLLKARRCVGNMRLQ